MSYRLLFIESAFYLLLEINQMLFVLLSDPVVRSACVLKPVQYVCPVELCVVGRSPVPVQKQLSFAVTTARCGPDTRLGPCALHGVLWSNTRPPHYRPGGSVRSAHALNIYAFAPKTYKIRFIVGILSSESSLTPISRVWHRCVHVDSL